tara:strand:+ start:843 stop:986 length:144 start_codon:yes stop_codon:yes gene_type:complete
MKNFVNLADIDKKDLRVILEQAKLQKKKHIGSQFKWQFKRKNFNYDF